MQSQHHTLILSAKAERYIAAQQRTRLHPEEVKRLIAERRYVHLGTTNVEFYLVWDHRKNEPVIILLGITAFTTTLVSIWEPHYNGIPNGLPTPRQILTAWDMALPAPATALQSAA